MKNTNRKAFTLVELIVVITILAILGTIAFISLQWYSQDAKNSKVASDLGTLASAIEISNTKGNTTIAGLLDNAKNSGVSLPTGTFGSGLTITDGTNAGIGWVDFAALNQNGADFKDSDGKDYIYSYAASGSVAYYQVVWQVKEASGSNKVLVKGNYVEKITSDVDGLVAWTTNTGGLKNNDIDTIAWY